MDRAKDNHSLGSRNDYNEMRIPTIKQPGPNSERAQTSESRRLNRTINFYNTSEGQNMKIEQLIGLALDRKRISKQYYNNAYPYFLRSQGPFKVYDHAKAKG